MNNQKLKTSRNHDIIFTTEGSPISWSRHMLTDRIRFEAHEGYVAEVFDHNSCSKKCPLKRQWDLIIMRRWNF